MKRAAGWRVRRGIGDSIRLQVSKTLVAGHICFAEVKYNEEQEYQNSLILYSEAPVSSFAIRD